MQIAWITSFRARNYGKYPQDYYYDKLLSKYESPAVYAEFYESAKLMKLPAETEIFLHEEIPFGASPEIVTGVLGKPNYIFKNESDPRIKIFLYRFKLGGFKTKCEIHFFNEQLFFFTYIFTYLTLEDKLKILQMLSEKYLNDKGFDPVNQKLVDRYGSQLMVNDSVDFSVIYLSGDNAIFDRITDQLNSKQRAIQSHLKLLSSQLYKFL